LLTHEQTSTLFPYTTLFRSYEDPNKLLNNRERFELPRGAFIYVNGTVNKIEKRKVIASQKSWENLKDDIAVLSLHDLLITNSERSEEHTSELQSRFDLVCRL